MKININIDIAPEETAALFSRGISPADFKKAFRRELNEVADEMSASLERANHLNAKSYHIQ